MSRYTVAVAGVALFTGISLACSNAGAPLAPNPNSGAANTAADGSTLKASAPANLSPNSDTKLTATPLLTASGSAPTFPAAGLQALQYRFQVFDPANTLVQDSGPVPTPNFAVTAALQGEVRHTWRVRAEYLGSVGPWSAVASFISPVPFDMHQATILDNPSDLASWAETSTITYADTSTYVIVDHSKRTGPGRWPESGFGTGGLQYTLGMCFNLGNHWFCSAAIQFWFGRNLAEGGGPARNIALNWYYDARWGPMNGHQPAQGETIGIFVAQGNLRDIGNTTLKERSNVVLMPFGSVYRK